MRVVSLVPSLTESLLWAGAQVVGRTRYCVHPVDQVRGISIVGGTKDLDLSQLAELKPDLLVLDREENLPWMKEQAPCAVHVFHAENVQGMAAEVRKLAACFDGEPFQKLTEMSGRWQRVAEKPPLAWNWQKIPGEEKRRGTDKKRNWDQILYLIWRNPWMSVSTGTFIGSVFSHLGAKNFWPIFPNKYPQIELENFDPEKTMLLLSSEPYPFRKKWPEFESLTHAQVLVDGELFSWFGIRTLEFLENQKGLKAP